MQLLTTTIIKVIYRYYRTDIYFDALVERKKGYSKKNVLK